MHFCRALKTLLMALFLIVFLGSLSFFFAAPAFAEIAPTETFKVGFVGDQEIKGQSYQVLRTMREQGVKLMVILGDFDYHDNPTAWNTMMTNELTNYGIPYIVAGGNHDMARWTDYRRNIAAQLTKFPEVQCEGVLGDNETCTYKGVAFVISGMGTFDEKNPRTNEYLQALRDRLEAKKDYVWKFCAWHKNHSTMQLGEKRDEVRLDAYDICRQNGAAIMTGHEHSYSRTRTFNNAFNQVVDPEFPDANTLVLRPGSTFAVVSGLGGADPRKQRRCTPTTFPYGCNNFWGKIISTSQGGGSGDSFKSFGAMIIEFKAGGDPRKANGYFKSISSEAEFSVRDNFTITSYNAPPANCTVQGFKRIGNTTADPNSAEGKAQILVDGQVRPEGQANPYFISVTNGSHSVRLDTIDESKYTIGHSVCNNATNCHGTQQAGREVQVTCANGHYIDLWWHLTLKSTPTPIPTTPTPTPIRKPGDVDRDNDVDIFDYNKLLEFFGQDKCDVNLAETCRIDIFDFNQVIENFGK